MRIQAFLRIVPLSVAVGGLCAASATGQRRAIGAPASRPAARAEKLPALPAPDFAKLQSSPVVRVLPGAAVVIRVAGNDTVIRALGIATTDADDARYARVADTFVRNLLRGESVYVVRDQREGAPYEYAYLYRAPDGLFVNAELIRQGYARLAPQARFQHRRAFLALERRAAKARKGLWGLPARRPTTPASPRRPPPTRAAPATRPPRAAALPSAPPITPTPEKRILDYKGRYIGNMQSFIYHEPACRLAKRAPFPEQIKSPRDAQRKSYRPCRLCKPDR